MKCLRVLIAEDSEDDLLLVEAELKSAGFDLVMERVENADDMRRSLAQSEWDLVLSDYTMPQFDALEALRLLQESDRRDVPFIIVSGSIGEVRAVEALKAGAGDYVMKENLQKLVPVVERELKDAQARRERSEAFEALREAVKARDDFLSIASHELKTPLTALNLQIHSLRKAIERRLTDPADSGDSMLSKCESVARSSDRLTQLIERLLDITRVTTGRLELTVEDVELTSLAKEVVSRVGEAFEGGGASIAIRTQGFISGRWDRDRLEVVLSNLLTNAAKFGGGKPVGLEIENLGDVARIRVIDHGIGISEADQQRIFGRFERAVPQRHYGGFGIGLWLSQRIVEAHGGSIDVESAPGAGSTFTVTLPMAPSSP